MASANVELVRSVVAAWERGDYGSAGWAHPEIEYVQADGPTPGRWNGVAEMGRVWGEWLADTFEDWRAVSDEVRELDDTRVLSRGRFTGRAKRSGLELGDGLGTRGASLFEVRDGRVTKLVIYWDEERALALAALLEEGPRAYDEGGPDAVAATWHEDVVYEEDPRFPGGGIHRGRDAVLARFREYEEQLGHGDVTIESVDDRGDYVLLVWRHSGTTPGAALPFEHRWAWLVRLRDGKPVHIRAFFDPDEARREAEPERG
jgi:ketosteroid isomerase-like protein